VENLGGADLHIASQAVIDDTLGCFRETEGFEPTVGVGMSSTAVIEFRPASIGECTGQLRVTEDGEALNVPTQNGAVVIELTGSGVDGG
jgi:hypothetical protein